MRQPGDGTVGYIQDNDSTLNGSVPAFDKEWMTAGPRPAGVAPQCFTGFHVPKGYIYAAMAFSARYSWLKPSAAFRTMMAMIASASL